MTLSIVLGSTLSGVVRAGEIVFGAIPLGRERDWEKGCLTEGKAWRLRMIRQSPECCKPRPCVVLGSMTLKTHQRKEQTAFPSPVELKFSSNYLRLIIPLKLALEKAKEPEIKLPTSAGSWKKQETSRKTSISALLTVPRPLTVWIIINCGKFWKRWEYQTT